MATLDDETIKRIKHLYQTMPRNDMPEMQVVGQIAEITGVSVRTVYRYRSKYAAPAICPACGMRYVAFNNSGARYGFCAECADQHDARREV